MVTGPYPHKSKLLYLNECIYPEVVTNSLNIRVSPFQLVRTCTRLNNSNFLKLVNLLFNNNKIMENNRIRFVYFCLVAWSKLIKASLLNVGWNRCLNLFVRATSSSEYYMVHKPAILFLHLLLLNQTWNRLS